MSFKRCLRSYDHRLVELVQKTGDASIATDLGVPRSTAAGWIRRAPRPVTTAPDEDASAADLRLRVAVLEKRCGRLRAVLRVLFVLLRILKPDLSHLRIPAPDKERLLRAVDRTRGVLGLRRVLSLFGLSASRLHAWRVAARECQLEDRDSCPLTTPEALTPTEISRMREMVTASAYRHVPTSRLALLAQRMGTVFACPSTWCRLVRERGWRRPRLRVHPEQPREGIRAAKPNEYFHIDTTMIRLLDHTRLYLHAVIDNFSRRILAWRLADRFDPGNALAVLVEAGRSLVGALTPPTVVADSGVENKNAKVDELLESGLLKRVLALTEVHFSNSLIEAWWRCLKHQWLFLHPLDSLAKVHRLVAFYVEQHNSVLPHSAFHGQTPDEMYLGKGDTVPDALAAARENARDARLREHRARACAVCA